MAAKPILLMFFALLILIIPGALYNNLTASALAPPSQTLVCSGYPDLTCHGNTAVGCQSIPSQCTLSGNSFAFLNQASPFTQLLSGNIFGFFTQLNSRGGEYQHGPFDQAGGGPFFNANCGVVPNLGTTLKSWSIASCVQTSADNKNVTKRQATNTTNWNPLQSGVALLHNWADNGQNATYSNSCSWTFQINYTITGQSGYTYYGCTRFKTANSITNPQWPYLIAVPNTVNPIPAGYSHQYVFMQPEPWYTQNCIGGSGGNGIYETQQCDNFRNSFKGITLTGGTGLYSTSFVPGISWGTLGFLAGIALFVIGLGLSFALTGSFFGSGGGLSMGVNAAGTRLAQVLGIGLIIYSPLSSEFSTWIVPSILPNGLDTFILILVPAMFFTGMVWMMWGTGGDG